MSAFSPLLGKIRQLCCLALSSLFLLGAGPALSEASVSFQKSAPILALATPQETGLASSEGTYSHPTGQGQPEIPAPSLQIDPASLTLPVGNSVTITAAIIPQGVTQGQILWSVSDPTVFTIQSINGATVTIEAVGVGNATLIAETADGVHLAPTTVTVTSPITLVLRIGFRSTALA